MLMLMSLTAPDVKKKTDYSVGLEKVGHVELLFIFTLKLRITFTQLINMHQGVLILIIICDKYIGVL